MEFKDLQLKRKVLWSKTVWKLPPQQEKELRKEALEKAEKAEKRRSDKSGE